MRIRRLDIVGFKSFMDKTVVAFDEGVTGVVGPNGCGKSNVADAIRWVLGEQSARQLRGRSMEDVIFNGSESKAPLSMAEVLLTFENDRPGELPAAYQGFGEITVGRRLFRTGESEYLVNGVQARLLDVNDIFFGSGVGRTAYSIIEQGRIGQIVSARPEDRRAVIEEAAGISKYKRRREAAERKMEATQQNLLRVADIVQELGKQLESLNRQARKAEKYKAVRAQIRELELRTAAARYLELTATRRAADEREALLRQREELSSLVVSDEGRLGEAESSLKEAAREQGSLSGEADRSRASAAAARAEATAHRTQLGQVERQRTDLRARMDRSRGEAADVRRKVAELDAARSAYVEKLGRTRQLMLRLDEQRGAQEELLERTRAEFIQNEAKLITLREELVEKRSRLHSLLEIVRNYEGYGRGVRSLMTRANDQSLGEARDRGIFGLVADV